MFRDFVDFKNSKYSLVTLPTLQSKDKEQLTLFNLTLKKEKLRSSETSVPKECNMAIPATKQYHCSREPVQSKESAGEYHQRTVPVYIVSVQNSASETRYQERTDAMQYSVSIDTTEVKRRTAVSMQKRTSAIRSQYRRESMQHNICTEEHHCKTVPFYYRTCEVQYQYSRRMQIQHQCSRLSVEICNSAVQ